MSGKASWKNRGGKSGGGAGGGSGGKGKGKEPQKDPSGTLVFAPTLEIRGKPFSTGTQFKVDTNHFRLLSLPDKSTAIYQYGISLKLPKKHGKSGSRSDSSAQSDDPRPIVMQKAWESIQDLDCFGTQDGHAAVWDGQSTVWSTKLISDEDLLSLPNLLNLRGHTEDRPNQLLFTVEMQRTLEIPALVSHVTTSGSAGVVYDHPANTLYDCFRWLTEAFRDGPASRMISFRKSTTFFSDDRKPGMVLPLRNTDSLEVRRGLEQRVTFAFNTLNINVHTKCGIFRQPNKLLSVMALAQTRYGATGTSRLRAEDLQMLIGMQFVMQYGEKHKNSRKKKLLRISTQTATTHKFDHGGKNVTVQQYFKAKYGIVLKYPGLPLLETNGGTLMPLELAYTASDEYAKKAKLTDQASSDFVGFASRMPLEKRGDVRNCVSLLNGWEDTNLKRFGLEVDPSMMEVGAIRLPAPELSFHANPQAQKKREVPTSGIWDLKDKKFVQPKNFGTCGAVAYVFSEGTKLAFSDIKNFTLELLNTCRGHGMQTANVLPQVIGIAATELTIVQDQKLLFSQKFLRMFPARPQFIIFVIHKYMQEPYRKIKHICDGLGIASQCVQAEKLSKTGGGAAQYRSNLALKINSKLGGINWNVDNKSFSKLNDLMIIAADVVHSSPADQNFGELNPSIAVLVGSIDEHCVKYVAEEIKQDVCQEVIDQSNMKIMFADLLKRYHKANNKYPKHVIFLRDGVSDSQIPALIENEVAALKSIRDSTSTSTTSANKNQKPAFTITSVNCIKRHHTRFFPKDTSTNKNVDPGTCVEASLGTSDFFLVAHNSPLGTSRPTRYTIIDDENNLTIGQLESMINQGCFGFQRSTRTIALHTAVKHADRCAERARVRLRKDEGSGQMRLYPVNEALKDSMYWL